MKVPVPRSENMELKYEMEIIKFCVSILQETSYLYIPVWFYYPEIKHFLNFRNQITYFSKRLSSNYNEHLISTAKKIGISKRCMKRYKAESFTRNKLSLYSIAQNDFSSEYMGKATAKINWSTYSNWIDVAAKFMYIRVRSTQVSSPDSSLLIWWPPVLKTLLTFCFYLTRQSVPSASAPFCFPNLLYFTSFTPAGDGKR